MISGIGIDIVQTRRMERWCKQRELLERYFHPHELSVALSRGKGTANAAVYQALACRFAAKEAFGKALGTGLAGIVLKDIMVINSHKGRPELQVFDSALKALEKNGANRVHVSLAHEQDNAVAVVVLEVI